MFPERFVWTRAKYEQAAQVGLLGPDDHIELIEGECVCKARQNSLCSTAQCLGEEALDHIFGEGFDVRGQQLLTLDDESQPEPDVAVVTGSPRDFKAAHPTAQATALVVEVSDTTLGYDCTKKAHIYVRVGIREYWIVNINDRVLEVHRQPAPTEGGPVSHVYRDVRRLTETEIISPLAAVEAVIAVADLLP